jgi:hypothetical protein
MGAVSNYDVACSTVVVNTDDRARGFTGVVANAL